MADGQYGGNESVHWIVNADEASDVLDGPDGVDGNNAREVTRPTNGKRCKWRQSGIDYHDVPDVLSDFTVRIKLPAGKATRTAFLKALRAQVNRALHNPAVPRLEFQLGIETGRIARTQIQVCWGKDTPWYEGLQAVQTHVDKDTAAGIASGGTAV